MQHDLVDAAEPLSVAARGVAYRRPPSGPCESLSGRSASTAPHDEEGEREEADYDSIVLPLLAGVRPAPCVGASSSAEDTTAALVASLREVALTNGYWLGDDAAPWARSLEAAVDDEYKQLL
jgi:hypothetical protein